MNISDNHTKTFRPNLPNFLDSIFIFLTLEAINPVINSNVTNNVKDNIVKLCKPKADSIILEIPAMGIVKANSLVCTMDFVKSVILSKPKFSTNRP